MIAGAITHIAKGTPKGVPFTVQDAQAVAAAGGAILLSRCGRNLKPKFTRHINFGHHKPAFAQSAKDNPKVENLSAEEYCI